MKKLIASSRVLSSVITKQTFYILLFCIFFASCKPKQSAVRNNKQEAFSYVQDTTFWQEYHEAYPVGSDPVDTEVRSIAVDRQGNVWIATPVGVFKKKSR